MKIFFSEFAADYDSFSYPYQVCGIREEDDRLELIYDNGFLPTRIDKRLFYLCRSFRVELKRFALSSENRRIQKKCEDLQLEVKSLKDFTYDYKIGKFANEFYRKKFGPKTMSAQKAKWLFTSGAMTDVIQYKIGERVVGYCLVNKTGEIIHYAYPFYDLQYNNSNLGIGMMLNAILFAKDKDIKYVYLGTVYTLSSLYKTQFEGGEFFTGLNWNPEISLLKDLVRSEKHHRHSFARAENKAEIVDSILK